MRRMLGRVDIGPLSPPPDPITRCRAVTERHSRQRGCPLLLSAVQDRVDSEAESAVPPRALLRIAVYARSRIRMMMRTSVPRPMPMYIVPPSDAGNHLRLP